MSAHIDHTTETELHTPDGTRLFIRDWPLPDDAVWRKEGVVIMHGLGEHCGRYAHVARFFNALGFTVRTYDMRGHGKSSGSSGNVPDDEAMLRDAELVIKDFSVDLACAPILFGHSMGGLFAARFALAETAPLRALILSSPALALHMSGVQRGLLRIASLLCPSLGLANGLNTRYLSHDAEVIYAYRNDPLVHPRISARLLNAMISAIAYTQQKAATLHLPTLLLAAVDDHLVDPEGSRRFAAAAGNAYLSTHFYAGFYHEIFNELDPTPVFDDLRTWLEVQQISPLMQPEA
ncbi:MULTISPECIES: alpha/beta hydrolase [unclassified Undibacterium]|uniref:alpha/beta hydrolase n=1 Tax=unclassified Undibacterium TaxID=2630295 RepID=UPI002AC9D9AE|nr:MULTISPECIES: alpha/beta hydrolase [unclassified Undibacterium]MEB0140795.1 alpha/beta hydrolase [Undibacterium sp. CCC2.1]MEB0173769.1 alpha/beta hydrolase [Undibacterium sp. CCC1.1]MEB0177754.1 alpha/beta hydrolase [Undibacterium sp. CCC3.4]MEB0216954.1 alpha/beta hydrolase [Undibacterium sp. 5I2]WPX44678.1 alpha/beta hydrolase [Undibacterium sp. CCC3.4]